MNEPPAALDGAEIVEALEEGWGLAARGIEHLPVGFGGWHWRVDAADGRSWFITADRLGRGGHSLSSDPDAVFAGLCAAYGTAIALAAAGCDFVLAQVPARDGAAVRRVGPDYAVSVTPYVVGSSGPGGEWPEERVRAEVAEMVGRLHALPAPDGVPRWQPGVPHRAQLLTALSELARPWTGGRFSEPARRELAAHQSRVRDLLHRHDELVAPAVASRWVVTHGEVHSANVLCTDDGRVLLVDWDTVAFAPRERDLWSFLPCAGTPGWDRYAKACGDDAPPSAAGIELRETWWTVAEIAEYVARFRCPHDGGTDDEVAWTELLGYLAG